MPACTISSRSERRSARWRAPTPKRERAEPSSGAALTDE